jgi:transposase
MRKPEHRLAADRRGLRYQSDLIDAECGIVAPIIPPGQHGGRRRSVNVREVLNGIFYVLWTGCQWKALPKDLPPKSTVHNYLELWNWDGTLSASITRCTWRCAKRRDMKHARRWRSSTRRSLQRSLRRFRFPRR